MTKEQLVIISAMFILSSGAYLILKKRFPNVKDLVRVNLILIIAGIAGAFIITPFIIPNDIYKNLLVLTIIPIVTYNFYYLINYFTVSFSVGVIIREIISLLSITVGILIGAEIVNLFNIASFQISDIKDTLLIAMAFNTARIIFSYAGMLKLFKKNQNEIKIIRQKEAYVQEKLDLLYSKINPHFLYNSLNSIAGLAMIDGRRTRDMTIALSKLLRYSLDYSEDKYSTIEEEAESIVTYFEVEKIRFEDKLRYEINIQDETEKFLVPRFLFQPLVENCIKHGFEKDEKNNFVKADVRKINNELVISIHDNGKPFPEKLLPGYGLKNVSDKLDLLYPGKYEMQILNSPVKEMKIIIKDLRK